MGAPDASISPETREWLHFYHRYTGLGAIKAHLEAQANATWTLLARGAVKEAAEKAESALGTLSDMRSASQRLRESSAPASLRPLQELEAFRPERFEAVFHKILRQARRAPNEAAVLDTALPVQVEFERRTTQTVTYGYATILTFRVNATADVRRASKNIALIVYHPDHGVLAQVRLPATDVRPPEMPGTVVEVDLGDSYDGELRLEVRSTAHGGVNTTQVYSVGETGIKAVD